MNKAQLRKRLPGPTNNDARNLYQSLEIHLAVGCPQCKCYPKYGVILFTGDLLQHLADISSDNCEMSVNDAIDMLDRMETAGLIEIEQDKHSPHLHRIVFVYLQAQESQESAA